MGHALVPRHPVADPAVPLWEVNTSPSFAEANQDDVRRRAFVPKHVAEQLQRAAFTTLFLKDGREVHASVASFHARDRTPIDDVSAAGLGRDAVVFCCAIPPNGARQRDAVPQGVSRMMEAKS